MEHLRLEIFDLEGTGSKFAWLSEDASITITDTSEIFASGDVWSHSFTLNVRANAHIFGTAGDMHGSRLHEQINKRRARLWVEGVALYLGYLKLDNEVEVDSKGNVDVSFESGQKTFDEMIEGAKANQVPMMSDIQIGMALWRKRWTKFRVKLQASLAGSQLSDNAIIERMTFSGPVTRNGNEWFDFSYDGESDGNSSQQYPRMVFPNGDFTDYGHVAPDENQNHINTDTPYDDSHPYCNVALCYQKYGYQKKNPDGSIYDDYSSEPEAQRGYEIMPANRLNSAPNFFVIYWIKALMKHLGIYIEENQMMDVEDLRRLFFANTNCAYEEPANLKGANLTRYGKYFRYKWQTDYIPEYINSKKNINAEESGFVGKNVKIISGDIPSSISLSDRISISVSEIEEWSDSDKKSYLSHNRFYHKAFASSDCFPNVDISDVISAIENGFGVRLLFDSNFQRVRIVLLRNIFRNGDVQNVECEIISEGKVENSIRGFRMSYGESEDTTFYYKGFADKLPHKKELWADNSDKHDYSKWDLDANYGQIIHKISAFDKTCYVTKNNGNAYGIKVDKDAKRYDELHPSLFEYAGYMDAEDGDCTGDEETIETINVGFVPAIMNDVNFEQERKNGDTAQRFALFVDATMKPRRIDLNDGKDYDDPKTAYDIDKLYSDDSPAAKMKSDDGIVKPGEFAARSDMYASCNGAASELRGNFFLYNFNTSITFDIDGHINEGYRLYLQDNFDPNDDGISPIETKDWGLTLGIMRGSGSDSYVNYEADPDDGEGNDTWEIMAGSNVSAHPDTCDSYGNEWDYNGMAEGVGDREGRVSLKLRAEKLNPYFDPKQPESATNRRYLEISNPNLRGRGLIDQFYKEYSFWTRNARIANRTVRMELAQLLAIDKTKKVTVGDITGFIRKMQYSVNNKTGLGNVTMEIMYI